MNLRWAWLLNGTLSAHQSLVLESVLAAGPERALALTDHAPVDLRAIILAVAIAK
jgi:hypothetical protein